jgi:3-oxoacyl-[acyl-carrier-protein] synthase-3
MQSLPVKILGTGIYLPPTVVTAAEIDRRAGLSPGWTKKHSGVLTRHFATDESAAFMGARAVADALARVSELHENVPHVTR